MKNIWILLGVRIHDLNASNEDPRSMKCTRNCKPEIVNPDPYLYNPKLYTLTLKIN